MTRAVLVFVAVLFVAGEAAAQSPPPLLGAPREVSGSAKAMIGTWEFSNADRDRLCNVTFATDPAAIGFGLAFDEKCAAKFPLVADIVGWTFPENDLLRMHDAQGKPLIEFSEVETGIYEAPTAGVGVLFLQNPAIAVASRPEQKPEQFAGDWTLMRGNQQVLCTLTLSTGKAPGGFALNLAPDCDQSIARLALSSWQIDRGEIVLTTARGSVWRFEEGDDGKWQRLPADVDPIVLVRKR